MGTKSHTVSRHSLLTYQGKRSPGGKALAVCLLLGLAGVACVAAAPEVMSPVPQLAPVLADTPPEDVRGWLSNLGWVLWVLTAAFAAAKVISGKPSKQEISNQPLHVKEQPEWFPSKDAERLEQALRDIERVIPTLATRNELNDVKDDLSREGSRRAADLHRRLDTVQQELAKVTSLSDTTQARVIGLDGKLDKVLLELATREVTR